MPLFSRKNNRKREQIPEPVEDAAVAEELSEISAGGKRQEVVRAKDEAAKAISFATRADIKGMTLLGRGRCPECGSRTEALLFTNICSVCGWYRRTPTEQGRCVVHLDDRESIECDSVYDGKRDVVLCVKNHVVVSQVARRHIQRVDYLMDDTELAEAWERDRKQRKGVCSWCDRSLDTLADGESAIEEYVAFGAYQERYLFCSAKCLAAFRKQYTPRIHRNCYATNCNICDQCIKRFDTTGFERMTL